MEKSQIIVGLDIGTTKVCAIVGKKNDFGKIDIFGLGKTEPKDAILRGQVINIDRTVDAIKYAVSEASEKSGVDIKSVYVGIAGQHIKSLHHRGQITRHNGEDPINQADIDRLNEDMHKVVLEPGEQIIHVFPQDYIVDNERGIKEPKGIAGVRLEGNFHLITGHVHAINNIYRCIKLAGLEPAGLILEPVASADAVLNEDEKESGVVLVDIGGGTTDLAIFQEGILRHTAVIPLGGEIITQDIKNGCSVMYKDANKMKLKFGSALATETKDYEIITIPVPRGRTPKEISMKNLALIIEARCREIFDLIYYEMRSSGFDKKMMSGIVLTGGGALLKHLTQLVEYRTGLDARIGFPTEHLAGGLIQDVKSPMYSTCIGLVINGFKDTEAHPPVKPVEEPIIIERPIFEKPQVEEPIVTKEEEEEPPKTGGIVGHLLTKVKKWMQDDQVDFKSY
jgi:cell division protein FtsA